MNFVLSYLNFVGFFCLYYLYQIFFFVFMQPLTLYNLCLFYACLWKLLF
ncbi:hypothetical protein MtrunA17_Chr7g0270501 [Medicago truncatula]|uniref:Uncharacterized protein n=1 Tax=Medicago truncatula TaxID=3880 RepID=A0A396HDU4_MEDTR|nr:hypothetical protein MtrunA17_Chr7g0270501 [Medicago truncatula]